MRNTRSRAAAFLMVLAGLAPWGSAQPLTPDPRVTTGTLENGLTYYIFPHANPPKRAIVWMNVSTGSLNETQPQRGIAHYLEHMAFNGSKNYPPGTVVKYFESLGLQFGRHINASTSFSDTNYQLPLPDNSIEKVRQALLFMSDVNGRLLLDIGEIDAERQIIMEEKASRKSGRARVQEYMLTRTAPGTIFGDRLPIGVEETIKGVQRDDFVNYYTTYYTPSNSSVIVVGEIEPAAIAAEIQAAFADLPKKERAADATIGIKPYEKSFAVLATDPELTRASVGLLKVAPPRPSVTTAEQVRQELVQMLATQAFNRIMQEGVTEGQASFIGGIAFANNMSGVMWQTQTQATGEPDKWKEMLTDLGTYVQRTRLHGFSERSIEDARRDMMARAEQQASQEGTLPAMAHVRRILSAVSDGEPVQNAEQRLALLRAHIPSITPKECSDWFAAEFEPTNVMFFAQLPESLRTATSEDEILTLGAAAFSVKPEAVTKAANAEKLLEKLPTPGTVVENVSIAGDVTSAWLSNGTRVHHKFTDYRKDDVTVTVSFYGSELLETPANRGIAALATQAWSQMATGTLTSSDMRSLMTGRKVDVGGRAGDDALVLTISGSPAELEYGMQAAYVLLTDPKLEDTAVSRWKTAQLQNIEGVAKNPSQYFSQMMARTVYPVSDVRTQPLTVEQVNALTREGAQRWLLEQLASAPIEVAIVGDISKDAAMELVTKYIGSLPTRQRVDGKEFAAKRQLPKPQGGKAARETIVSKTDTANVMVGFHGPDATNLADSRAMSMASRIISTRMVQEIREKEQLVYSISAQSAPGNVFPGYGLFRAGAPTQPAKVDALAAKIAVMYEEFAATGPTEEELKVAKGQFANIADEQMKEPGFWLGNIQNMTYDDTKLEDALAYPAAMQALTAEEVTTVFKKYYNKDALITLALTPTPEPAPTK
jgi:zinc protease